jgi:uncharacterized protein (TIGR00661 family)
MTQAMSLCEILMQDGHEVAAVLVGKSSRREIPDFFVNFFGNRRIFRFDSPNFLPSSKKKKPNLWTSAVYNFMKTGSYLKSISFIKAKIKELDVDVVVNFYDLLMGLTYLFFPPRVPYICIAHQYLFLHPDYRFPHENRIELLLMKFFTKLTCLRAKRLLALSINELGDIPKRRLLVVPPLLRKEVLTSEPSDGDYLHGYMLNANYADEIIKFQQDNPDVKIHFFWDKRGADEETVINDNLTFHKLNDHLFVKYMAGCRAYATTAGFESVCEAMYFGKPTLMVPTHIEQACNANEAEQAGAGVVAQDFELGKLLDFIPLYQKNSRFREWLGKSETAILKGFHEVLGCVELL